MAEPITPPAVTPPASNDGGNGGNSDGNQSDAQKTFTQDELNDIVSKRLASESEKFDKKLNERLKTERETWEKQSKLSEEERQAELLAKQKEEYEERERSVTLRENKADAVAKLAELKVPISLVDFVVSLDKEKQETNITNLTKAYGEAVEAGVAERMKGNPPKDPSNLNKGTGDTKVVTQF